MNYSDVSFFFLLSNLALLCYVAVSGSHMETTARILLASLVLVFALIVLARVFHLHLPKCCVCPKHLLQRVMKVNFIGEAELCIDTPTPEQFFCCFFYIRYDLQYAKVPVNTFKISQLIRSL